MLPAQLVAHGLADKRIRCLLVARQRHQAHARLNKRHGIIRVSHQSRGGLGLVAVHIRRPGRGRTHERLCLGTVLFGHLLLVCGLGRQLPRFSRLSSLLDVAKIPVHDAHDLPHLAVMPSPILLPLELDWPSTVGRPIRLPYCCSAPICWP